MNQRLRNLTPYALALLSGVIWFLSCPPYPFYPAAWVAMIPLYFALRDRRGKSAFFLGWLTGLAAMMGGFPWITDLIVTFGKMPTFVAFPITILYNSYQALLFGLFALLFTWFRDHTRLPIWLNGVLVIAVVEYFFPLIFPWYFAITQAFVPWAIQIAEYTGPIGVSALLLLTNGLVFEVLTLALARRRPPVTLAIPLVLLALILGWSVYRRGQVASEARHRFSIGVAMVQPNIGIPRERQRWFGVKQVLSHQRMSVLAETLRDKHELPRLDLLVWSESSYPFKVGRSQDRDFEDSGARMDLRRIRRGFTTPLLMGAGTSDRPDDYSSERRVYNSALLFDRDSRIVGRYDKNWLLMFGEYIPMYEYMPFLHSFFRAHRMSNMTRGRRVANLTLRGVPDGAQSRDVAFGPLICYEDILPEFGRKSAANNPNILFNITNDAWFGATQEPWQHLALAVFRTVETRLPMVRNVNIGVSAFIGPDGTVGVKAPSGDPPDDPTPRRGIREFSQDLREMPMKKVGPGLWRMERWPYSWLVYSTVPVMSGKKTFYVRFGNILIWLMILAAAVMAGRVIRPTPARIRAWWAGRRARRAAEKEARRQAKDAGRAGVRSLSPAGKTSNGQEPGRRRGGRRGRKK